jgi:hypothetical protein
LQAHAGANFIIKFFGASHFEGKRFLVGFGATPAHLVGMR